MTILYADLAFFLNVGMDYLLLRCTAFLSGLPVLSKRLLSAAVVGSLYGTVAMTGRGHHPLLVCLTAGVMVVVCFGWDRFFLRRYLLFWTVSAVLSGTCTALQTLWFHASSPWIIFLVTALILWSVFSVVFRGAGDERVGKVRAEIMHEGRKIRLTLLRDSGNTLRDPHSGQILCIIWKKALEPIFIGKRVFFHRIAYQSLGTAQGELSYFYCDAITVDGTTYYRYPIGLASHPFSGGGGVAGLWGENRKGER